MSSKTIRDFSKRGDALPVPVLTRVQADAYKRFLQLEKVHDERDTNLGLEALMREVFPIESYDGSMKLEYLHYKLDPPRYRPDECRELRLTYGMPFRIWMRLVKEQPVEEEVYLGDIPVMIGGGEFIINGAERVVVAQLHRSPGVFFDDAIHPNGTKIYSARIIPFKGSWVEFTTDIHDVMYAYIDRKKKFPVTTLLRALGYSSDEDLLALEIREALQELGRITGAVYTDDILDRIFSRFCIGK